MSKTKRQLRAEAAERLNTLMRSGELCTADRVLHTVADDIVELRDLLTDDEPPEGDAIARDVVERDYVRRDSAQSTIDDLVRRLAEVGREVDRLQRRLDEALEARDKAQADADNIGSACDKLRMQMSELRHDYVELMAESLDRAMQHRPS